MGGFREDSGKRTERDGAGTKFWKIFRKESVNIVNLIVCIMLNHGISSNSGPGFGFRLYVPYLCLVGKIQTLLFILVREQFITSVLCLFIAPL